MSIAAKNAENDKEKNDDGSVCSYMASAGSELTVYRTCRTPTLGLARGRLQGRIRRGIRQQLHVHGFECALYLNSMTARLIHNMLYSHSLPSHRRAFPSTVASVSLPLPTSDDDDDNNAMPTLLSIPAGRLQRRDPESKWLDANPAKGELVVSFDEGDELLWLRESQSDS